MNTIEIELKFQVPAEAGLDVAHALSAFNPEATRMQAVYFDTPDRRLAAQGGALRLRLEGAHWFQTAKAGDPHALTRLEHNAPVATPPDGSAPVLDLGRHAGTPVGRVLAKALAGATPTALYRTDIVRTHAVVPAEGGQVELAFDRGEITGGQACWPVHELEIECVEGDAHAVIAAARPWVSAHGVWLDARTKAERGDRLARGVTTGVPVQAEAARPGDSPDHALARALKHLLPNASEVASGTFTAAHLVEVRAALAALQQQLGAPASAEVDAHAVLAAARAACESATDAPGALRAPAFTQVLLSALALTLPTAPVR